MSETSAQETVLITGGTDGLGRAATIRLAQEGYRVFAAGRSAEKRAKLEEYARQGGLPLETVEMDVCDDASVARALDEVRGRAGPLGVLVNSAGIAYVAPMEEIALDDLRRQFETNFFGVVRVIQRVLPEMRARRRGRIVNVSSVAGKLALPLFGPYSGTKFALEGMTDALRLELHPFGIEVVLIEPGFISTSMQDTAIALSARYREGAAASPYGFLYENFRRAWSRRTRGTKYTPDDFARVVLRALRDAPPRPRYTVTRRARWLTLARRVLTDRALDRSLIRRFGLERREL
jgi:NAD(P)-dependent dehydrogenase (short-subunit alcohol dehydrogenase family)